ncbi:efflux RND transporter periplasmic adaptor subunit [Actinoplanes subtropicus]|uniref:efflux RND transporter periplasmic adaptor subunit n=1 Tax=Actinoplanes subtropicus TaxID=543632 RepID=UPI0004C3C41D|nr:HlyD family efflux transporter periplasmic adaptor subunit [Actinoplanes subtropicus]
MPARFDLRRPSVALNAVLAVAIAGGGFWAYEALAGPKSGSTAAGAAARTVTVETGTVTKTVTADGTVESAETASAGFVTGGVVTAIDVKVGQVVKKGQVLAKVDPAASERSLTAAEVNLTTAKDALTRAEAAGSDTSSAESDVESAQSAVDDAQAAVDGTVLTAPMAGTVTAVSGTIGSSASGGGSSSDSSSSSGSSASSGSSSSSDSSSSGSSSSGFVEIADLSKLQVTADFAEADATTLKEKQAGTITWTALAGATATGEVIAIDPSGTTSNDVVTYGVTLSIDKNPAGARVGQSVSVAITSGNVADATYVNSAAITTSGTRHTVTVVANGVRTVREVQIGLVGDSTTQIKSGVQAGEQVLVTTTSTTSGSTSSGGSLSNLGGGGGPGGDGGPPAGGAGP